ncbi:MAG: ABC transporter permease, partial [Candidatus Acidiferrales bacterium]
MEAFWQDIRYTLRMLAKAPGFTAVAILTLALGIGASTALFSVLNALVLRELPVSDPGRLVSFYTTRRNGHWGGITVLQLKEMESYQTVFTGVFGRSYPDNSNVEDNENIWPINLGKVTGQYYSVLGVKPALGRLITTDDAGISHGTPSAVAVI